MGEAKRRAVHGVGLLLSKKLGKLAELTHELEWQWLQRWEEEPGAGKEQR
jgi:hypothetical protein